MSSSPIFIKSALSLALAITLAGCGSSGGSSDSPGNGNNGAVESEQEERAGEGTIRVLSNRADLISGGDALVEVASPELENARVMLNDRDVSGAMETMENGALRGLITGLELGENELKVILGKGGVLRETLINHPKGGPVF
ncbi:MAG: hypothetical protein JJ867_10030, partial [Marinobacter sp.]|nr:hypothetical protein [Marinobacter sp.]